jgi:hypothetical protein
LSLHLYGHHHCLIVWKQSCGKKNFVFQLPSPFLFGMSSVGGPSSSSSSSSSIASVFLNQCNFLPEDDYNYLEDDDQWIQSCQKSFNNNPVIHEALIKLLFDLKSKYCEHPEKIKE